MKAAPGQIRAFCGAVAMAQVEITWCPADGAPGASS